MTDNLLLWLIGTGLVGGVAAAQAILVLAVFSGKGMRAVFEVATIARAIVPMAAGLALFQAVFGFDGGRIEVDTAHGWIELGAFLALPWLMALGMWLAYRRRGLLTRRDLYGISAWTGAVVLATGLWLGVS